eukprot:scaffold5348_cov79-Cylindrotheca_fusiformis.AAC.1
MKWTSHDECTRVPPCASDLLVGPSSSVVPPPRRLERRGTARVGPHRALLVDSSFAGKYS